MDKPVFNFVQSEDKPQNRKDIVLMNLKAVRDANAKGVKSEEINALIYFIISALPEISPDKYSVVKFWELEPSFEDVKRDYLRQINLLVPELIYRHIPQIEKWREEIYLRRLQKEAGVIHNLLKEHTNWMFDKESKTTLGK
jgi:hypothetical protein